MYSKYADDEGKGREIKVLPVPYEGAISYLGGTKEGPRAIIRASLEIETWDEDLKIDLLDRVKFTTLDYFEPVVKGPKYMFFAIYDYLKKTLSPEDFLLTLGGDHSIALAPIKFYRDIYPDLVIIHIDAHADLRDEFQGSKYSHGCVMARVREMGLKIIQVGIRSLCREESIKIHSDPHITTFFAGDILKIHPDIVAEKIATVVGNAPLYISLDVDGLDPSLLPGTGTPEPGGIPFLWIYSFWRYFFAHHVSLVGMDVCELAPIPNQVLSESTTVKMINRILSSCFGNL